MGARDPDVQRPLCTCRGRLDGGPSAPAGFLGRDDAIGRQYLKLPLPEGDAAQGALALLQGLLAPPR